jgi:hypothetical protein
MASTPSKPVFKPANPWAGMSKLTKGSRKKGSGTGRKGGRGGKGGGS